MADQWLSIVEYARTYAVSDMTIRRRIKTGRIKAVLREGKYYIPVGANGEILEDVEVPKAVALSMNAAPVEHTVSAPMPVIPPPMDQGNRLGASFKSLPQAVSQNLAKSEQSLVDTASLLQFCDKTVTRINSIEKHLQESYQAKIQSLESQLKLRDLTISQLKQQNEDLQMLVKLMEKR